MNSASCQLTRRQRSDAKPEGHGILLFAPKVLDDALAEMAPGFIAGLGPSFSPRLVPISGLLQYAAGCRSRNSIYISALAHGTFQCVRSSIG